METGAKYRKILNINLTDEQLLRVINFHDNFLMKIMVLIIIAIIIVIIILIIYIRKIAIKIIFLNLKKMHP